MPSVRVVNYPGDEMMEEIKWSSFRCCFGMDSLCCDYQIYIFKKIDEYLCSYLIS